MEFILRDFQAGDFESLWRIDQKCFPAGISYSRLELAAYMRRQGSFTLVAESPDRNDNGGEKRYESSTASFGFIVVEANRRGVGHIITIDVLPTARRLGIGSTLLSAAEEGLRVRHCSTVLLETAVDNQAALAFYKRHRYFLTKTLPRYYSNGVDALVLQKDLHSRAGAANLPR